MAGKAKTATPVAVFLCALHEYRDTYTSSAQLYVNGR